MSARRALSTLVLLASACTAAPLDEICPDVSEGELVISEVSQSQAGTLGQWLELYNAGSKVVDLAGLHVDQFAADGSSPRAMIVRDSIDLAPGAYAVLGRGETEAPPAHVTYAFGADLQTDFHQTGFFEVRACGALVDTLTATLPEDGTLAQDGDMTPDPDAEVGDGYCNDMTGDPIPGSPGAPNPPCP